MPWDPAASVSRSNGFPLDDPETVKEASEYYHSIPSLPYQGHVGQIRDVLDSIKNMEDKCITNSQQESLSISGKECTGEKKIFATGLDGRSAIEMIMATYKSAVEDHSVTVPIGKDDTFYRKYSMVKCMPHFHEKTRSVDRYDDTTMIL